MYRTIHRILLPAILLCAATTLRAQAAPQREVRQGNADPTVVAGAEGTVEEYVKAFNSGDAQRMREFFEKRAVADPARSTDARLETYRHLWESFGALESTDVQLSMDPSAARFTVEMKTAKQGLKKFIFTVDRVAPHKLAGLEIEDR